MWTFKKLVSNLKMTLKSLNWSLKMADNLKFDINTVSCFLTRRKMFLYFLKNCSYFYEIRETANLLKGTIFRVLATVKNSAANKVLPIWSIIEFPSLYFPNSE